MKILIINYEYPPLGGGGGAFSKDLAIALSDTNEVDVITSHYTGLPLEEKNGNLNIYRVPVLCRKSLYGASLLSMLSFPFTALVKGLLLSRHKKYDLINTHFAIPTGPAGLVLSYLTKTPNIVSVHGSDIYNPAAKYSPHKNNLLKWAVKTILGKADSIIAQSNNMKKHIDKFYSASNKVKVIPLGLPNLEIDELLTNIIPISESGLNLISIGRMAKVKGYDFLIRAMALLLEKTPNIKLKLIGDGPERTNLEALTNDLGLSKSITFTGWLTGSDKYKELLASDIYIMSSIHEGFGVVLLEAMACGLPIIATNSGGQVDIIKENRNGILVNTANEKALAKAVEDLILNKPKRQSISIYNKNDIAIFKISNILEKYLALFQSTIERKNKL